MKTYTNPKHLKAIQESFDRHIAEILDKGTVYSAEMDVARGNPYDISIPRLRRTFRYEGVTDNKKFYITIEE